MADIDLKTETPDTSLPTTGFLFGADSQASASPSVYSTQTVATTLLGSTSLTGATITADAPVLNMSQTWNASGVTFTGLRFNAAGSSDANSAAASLLMDLQVGGGSKFKVSKGGAITATGFSNFGSAVTGAGQFIGGAYTGDGTGTIGISLGWNTASTFGVVSGGLIGFTSSATDGRGALDALLTRRGAANLRLGAADAAAPVAQTLSVQSVVTGTSNTAGANLTITGSQGTGTGAGGSIIFQVAPAGSSGTAQNALVDALTISSTRSITIGGAWNDFQFRVPSGGGSRVFTIVDGATSCFTTSVSGTFSVGSFGLGASIATPDVFLARDAANTLALRNGANAQTFRVYNTTDGTNSEFGKIAWSSNTLVIGVETAGTGSNRVIELRNTGNRFVRIPTTGGMQLFNSANREVYIQWDAIGVRADAAFLWSSSSTSIGEGSGDTALVRAAANIVRVTNGSTGGGSLQLTEMTAPSAPATDNVRIYAEDNGSGKTRLMALFATGAAVQIAIEP